eukprot:TRINITY_DN15020_c0_g1_i1.p1 TRINITY_DN15020_c0_g1~~TRINITY_DN15020_c0_g1_i1.p1  ORF type:complete len:711 (+),score=167.79 TRINITY_DN15020_c0_g1_i1:84-2135(+)
MQPNVHQGNTGMGRQVPVGQGYTPTKQLHMPIEPAATRAPAQTPRPMVYRSAVALTPQTPGNQVCSSHGGSMSVQSFAASSMPGTPGAPSPPYNAWASSMSAIAVSSACPSPGNSVVASSACSGFTTPSPQLAPKVQQLQPPASSQASTVQGSQGGSQPASPRSSAGRPIRKVVGAPFERPIVTSPRGRGNRSSPRRTLPETKKKSSSPSPLLDSAEVSPRGRRTTASSSRISGATSATNASQSIAGTSRQGSICSAVGAKLRRCRSASLGSRSDCSWEGVSSGYASGCRSRLRSPRQSSPNRLSVGALSALGSEALEKERRETARSLQRENRWLRRALSEELRRVNEMEEQSQAEIDRLAEQEKLQKQAAERQAKLSEKHWEQSCQKKTEQESRRQQESREQRDAFEQQRLRLEAARQAEEQRQLDLREKRKREADKRMELLSDLEAKREADRERQELLRKQNEELEESRAQTLREQQQLQQQLRSTKKEARDLRQQRYAEAQQEIEAIRRHRMEERLRQLQLQEEKLAERQDKERQKAQEAAAATASKRQGARATAQRKQQDRQSTVSDKVVVKSDRVVTLASERQKLRDVRRNAQFEARKILRDAKSEVQRQSMSSRYCVKWLEEQLERIQNPDALAPGSPLSTSFSLNMSSQLDEAAEDVLSAHRAAGVDPSALHLQGP